MKHKIFLFTILLCFFLLFPKVFSYFIQKGNYSVYLTVAFQNPKTFNDSTVQRNIESNIENIFEEKGIHIVHKEKPDEYKLYINITIRDSLIIEGKDIGVGGISTVRVEKPRKAYKYKSQKEIYRWIKNYIKEYL
jgi:hypothetical protein